MSNEFNNKEMPETTEETKQCGCGGNHQAEGQCCQGEGNQEGQCCGNHDHKHDEGCGCDHHHGEEGQGEEILEDSAHTPMVIIENEDGTSEEYPIVDEFEYDDRIYVLVENADGTVTPLRANDDENGELEFLSEEEFEEVSEAYNEFMDAMDEGDETAFEDDEEFEDEDEADQ